MHGSESCCGDSDIVQLIWDSRSKTKILSAADTTSRFHLVSITLTKGLRTHGSETSCGSDTLSLSWCDELTSNGLSAADFTTLFD
jgi:hypothetical protein